MKTLAITILCSLFAGCVGVIGANAITAASETAAGNAIQHKALTVAQLSTLANDLAGLPQTPLPPTDNALIANLITELTAQKAANLTQGSAVDGINNAITALNSTGSVTTTEAVAWGDLQNVIKGLKAEVTFAQANPSMVPSS